MSFTRRLRGERALCGAHSPGGFGPGATGRDISTRRDPRDLEAGGRGRRRKPQIKSKVRPINLSASVGTWTVRYGTVRLPDGYAPAMPRRVVVCGGNPSGKEI